MKSLPDDRIPIPDSPGEAYYVKQRLNQNPPQDKAPVHFSNIPEPQREAFVQFWNNEDNARGTGQVKVPLGRREVITDNELTCILGYRSKFSRNISLKGLSLLAVWRDQIKTMLALVSH